MAEEERKKWGGIEKDRKINQKCKVVIQQKCGGKEKERENSGVAQMGERSLLIPEVRRSNPVISKNLFILYICLLSNVYWKDENDEKEAGDGPLFDKRKREREIKQKKRKFDSETLQKTQENNDSEPHRSSSVLLG